MIGSGKSLILSFDDGPAPVKALTKILQTLRQNSIKAEFYVLGSEVKQLIVNLDFSFGQARG